MFARDDLRLSGHSSREITSSTGRLAGCGEPDLASLLAAVRSNRDYFFCVFDETRNFTGEPA